MIRSILTAALLVGLPASVFADAMDVTEKGIKNLGSIMAYMMNCERAGFVPVGTLTDLMLGMRSAVIPSKADAIGVQYQVSLHEKKIYSPSRDQWFAAKIDKANCADGYTVVPSLLDAFKRFKATP